MSLPPPRTLRTKRNFKALQLPTGPTLNQPPTSSPGFRKPPLISTASTSSTSTVTAASTVHAPQHPAGNGIGAGTPLPSALNPNAPIPSTGDTPVTSQQRSAIRATITQTIAGFSRKSLDLQNEKLVHIREIGQGNGGSVSLVRHRDTDIIMAKKIVLIDAKPSVRKQIVRELQIMHECNSRYIIECYGSYLSDPNICICMEYMDRGSFDSIYKKIGPIQIEVVSRVAMSVLEGLTYLYDVHRIIHRDIKPSNILCNSKGEIKLCDFGVSGELINSIANTFVGTSIYMSPERIQGAEYSVKSDVWSLGITLVELATGRFPFSDDEDSDPLSITTTTTTGAAPSYASPLLSPGSRLPDLDEESVMIITAATASIHLNPYSTTTTTTTTTNSNSTLGTTHALPSPPPPSAGMRKQHTRRKSNGVSLHGGGMTMSIIELMHHIVREPAPRLPEARFVREAEEFVDACLEKEVDMRGTPGVLLRYKWVQDAKKSTFDVAKWARGFE
ncbi:Pkinase-domain-containing protein [Macrolepiota fuliginosa MF-IS2]|uniref:Pkinase-domain-containing protein n=1 Tax=Macrolepiota fuliginosa MF-IS2 TaxID=1400762 RepID=A0A9P6BX25_9AGAR|nr:Pkinase-domain-containing protein [Macrolepiota fuliginosa MF-IS2]